MSKHTTHTGLLVKDGRIERIEIESRGNSGSSHVHELIGNWFSSGFVVPGDGAHRTLVAYVDDDALIREPRPAWNVVLDRSIYPQHWPIAGPVVITAVVAPETVSMTEREQSAFGLLLGGIWRFPDLAGTEPIAVPTLTFRPSYPVGRP